jgi:hypothetical protein
MRAPKTIARPGIAPSRRLALASGFLLCATLAGVSKPAHAWDWGWGPKVTGSGHITTTTRSVSGFTGIDLSIPADIRIVQGSTEGLTLETDDNIAPLVETVVEKGHLVIRLQKKTGSISTKVLRMTVNIRAIEQLDVSGSGNIAADKLQATQLKCNISGSGDIRVGDLEASTLRISIAGSGDFLASGKTDTLEGSIAGSGDINTQSLSANVVKMSIAGSGDAAVWAKKALKVSIAGSGDVSYFGDAEVNKSIAGSGSIRHLGSGPASSKP